MNKQLEQFARGTLKIGLSQLTDNHRLMFKRMYANGHLELDINDVVDQMPEEKLDRAMEQVEETIRKKK